MSRVFTLDPTLITTQNYGLQELVRLVLLVSCFDCLDELLFVMGLAFAIDEPGNSGGDTLPALVAVHGIVPAGDGGDLDGCLVLFVIAVELFDEGLEIFRIADSRFRGSVAAVAEEVNEDVWDALCLCGLE
jgi:hypothetical protein